LRDIGMNMGFVRHKVVVCLYLALPDSDMFLFNIQITGKVSLTMFLLLEQATSASISSCNLPSNGRRVAPRLSGVRPHPADETAHYSATKLFSQCLLQIRQMPPPSFERWRSRRAMAAERARRDAFGITTMRVANDAHMHDWPAPLTSPSRLAGPRSGSWTVAKSSMSPP
jgi:hypothetical protein